MKRETLREHFADADKNTVVNLIYDEWERPGSTKRTQKHIKGVPLEELLEKYGDWEFDGAYTVLLTKERNEANVWATATDHRAYKEPEADCPGNNLKGDVKMFDWMEECECYGNGHEIFHIAQDNLTKEQVSDALKEIMGEDGWAADGYLDEKGCHFSTEKEDIEELAMKLSAYFPDATVFGQDCWDYEGYIVCFENGKPSRNYGSRYEDFKESGDDPDYYEIEVKIVSSNGYYFEAGGGLVHKENIPLFEEFVGDGRISWSDCESFCKAEPEDR